MHFNVALFCKMKIELWTIEKAGKSDFSAIIDDYAGRIQRYTKFDIKELDNSKMSAKQLATEEVKRKEWQLVEKLISPSDYIVLLDERGKHFRSEQLSEKINQWQLANTQRLIFFIAGAFGPATALRERANFTLSLSQFTLPHRIAKLLLTEQIYRAFSILNGEKYHHD